MKRCKHAIVESYWNTSSDEEGELKQYDKFGREYRSFLGIWSKPSPGPICGHVGNANEQFKERCGFFYCDEKRCNNCEFYEPLENGKEIKLKINNNRNKIPNNIRHEVFKRDNFKCIECGATNKEKTLHTDHITPISKGGTDELDNLQTLCETCNLSKSDLLYSKNE